MFTRNAVLSLLAVGVLLAGCDRDAMSPLAPEQGPEAGWVEVDGEYQKMVPITWRFRVWAVAPPSVPCLLPDGTVFGAVSPTYAVSGHLTHVGRLDEEASSATILGCQVILNQAGMPEAVSGPITAHLAGPQGDAVDLAGTLTLVFAAGEGIGDWEIVGGEGRFLGASGYIDTVEHPTEDGSASVGSGSGMITQPQPLNGGRGGGR